MDIRLDVDSGDAVFINSALSREDMETLESATVLDKKDTVAQRLTIQLKSFFNDWFLDSGYGVPYLQEILGKKGIRKNRIDSILRSEILKEAGVKEIIKFESSLSPNRVYSLSFVVKTSDGSIGNIIKLDRFL